MLAPDDVQAVADRQLISSHPFYKGRLHVDPYIKEVDTYAEVRHRISPRRRMNNAPYYTHPLDTAHEAEERCPGDKLLVATMLMHDAPEEAKDKQKIIVRKRGQRLETRVGESEIDVLQDIRSHFRAFMRGMFLWETRFVTSVVWILTKPEGQTEEGHVQASYAEPTDKAAIVTMSKNAKLIDNIVNARDFKERLEREPLKAAKWLSQKINMVHHLRGGNSGMYCDAIDVLTGCYFLMTAAMQASAAAGESSSLEKNITDELKRLSRNNKNLKEGVITLPRMKQRLHRLNRQRKELSKPPADITERIKLLRPSRKRKPSAASAGRPKRKAAIGRTPGPSV